ncbi:hypothetical protein [Aliarcobacter butzleri]|uniref:Uncharacterized protein n=1 Tax=Aliarcobacter butzleri L352 TaxID=1447260 RepID=A0A837JF42_9BACT|nr:hypothetical protein [Aliarcobacter butzleri]KLE06938.1 hypothetical protein AF77_00260 [Aliarcobacter butzleri L352]
MKKLFILLILFIGLNLSASNLAKTTGTIIEQEYKKIGAISCAEAMGKTIDFLLESREVSYNTRWDSSQPNKNTIFLSFKTKSLLNQFKFARYGNISYIADGNKCKGHYTYTEIVPGDCKVLFNNTKNKKDIILDNDGNNNDRYSFTIGNNIDMNLITHKSSDNINCTIIKSEFISLQK